MSRACFLTYLFPLLLGLSIGSTAWQQSQAEEADLKKMSIRARVLAMEPDLPVRIHWRYGSEGQGGEVVRGEFTRVKRTAPAAPRELPAAGDKKKKDLLGEDDPLNDLLGEDKKDSGQIEVEGQGFNFVYVKRGTWSPAMPVSVFSGGRRWPLHYTVTLQPYAKDENAADLRSIRNVEMEFELLLGDKVLKTFREAGPDGPTAGLALPLQMVHDGTAPDDPAFLDGVCGLARYAERRAEFLESLPWANRPLPKLYAIVTDCDGYGQGAGYGVRTTNMAVLENEFRALRQLGVNGMRGAPPEVIQMASRGEGWAKQFTRTIIGRSMGYPVPGANIDRDTGRLIGAADNAGCPYHPETHERAKPEVAATVAHMTGQTGFQEVWGLTVDEIGCIFDWSGEGKNHRYVCPHCMRGYREMLRSEGRKPEDFGVKSWEEVDPWTGPGPRPLTWQVALKQENDARYQKALGFKVRVPGEDEEAGQLDVLDDLKQAEAKAKAEAEGSKPVAVETKPTPVKKLLDYYNGRFLNYASAKAFTPLRDALDEANARKQAALDAGETDSPAAQQPWVYSYALRGQTFIGTHSLDFFEFYRYADNGFMYETSHTNCFTQIFDSYICDVGRVVTSQMHKQFGIYVKPHRGSGIQRAMSFASRGGTTLYWYTYGPEYSKGDSFANKPWLLEETSRCARLLGASEETLYGSKPGVPAEVAIVKPRTTTLLGGNISNALWTYVALAHAHVPVDPLDETMLETSDLSPYKVIYVNGSHLRRASAERVADWVKAGGTLYTSGGGMLLDEAQEPLEMLWPVFGVINRTAMETAPKDATDFEVVKSQEFPGTVKTRSREKLELADGAEVLTKFADGLPAVVRNKYGQGQVYLIAFSAGDEYGASVTRNTAEAPADMEANANPLLRNLVALPALEKTIPPVDVDRGNIEAIYLKHPQNQRRAVTLINWAYANDKAGTLRHKRFNNVQITLQPNEKISRVTSAWLDKELPITRAGDQISVTLPELWEADVLLIE
jgi:hypothetical protein